MFSNNFDFYYQQKLEKEPFQAIIIGGGIIGLSIARELTKNGLERILLIEKKIEVDDSQNGIKASLAAAGMLAPQAEADEADDFFELCRQSRDLYPNFARELYNETGIDIELNTTGTLYLAFNETDVEELEKRFAWQKSAGLQVEKLSAQEVLKLEPRISQKVLMALRFPLDWQVENRKLVAALKESLQKNKVCETVIAEAQEVIFRNNKVEYIEAAVEGNIFRLSASNIILAAGAWTSALKFSPDILPFETIPVRGQMLSFDSGKNLFSHTIYTPRGYAVPRNDQRILIGATVENVGYDNRTTASGVASLLETAFEISSDFQDLAISDSWSGLRPKSFDGLPILGEFPEDSGLHFATAHYRNGILLAPLTGKLIAEKIVNKTNSPFLQIYNPFRFQK